MYARSILAGTQAPNFFLPNSNHGIHLLHLGTKNLCKHTLKISQKTTPSCKENLVRALQINKFHRLIL